MTLDPQKIREILDLNFDSRQYFFTKANENLLDWLWDNGFMDEIKKKADDTTRYSYTLPELDYLVRMVEKKPKKVADIILSVSSSPDSYNPEVIDRFLRIAGALPLEELVRIIPKIRDENWAKIMGGFNHWGFEYEKIAEKLFNAKDYDNLVILAEVILSVQTKEEIEKMKRRDSPFYFNDLSYTKIFKYLPNVDQAHTEAVLSMAINSLTKIVLLDGKNREGEIFKIADSFYLFDTDFFTLEPGQENHMSVRDEVRELAALVKIMAVRLFDGKCENINEIEKIYKTYLGTLPDSRLMYRFKLFIFSLCPIAFKSEIKKSLFEIFNHEKPWDLISGAEYEQLILSSFYTLENSDQREYVKKVIELFDNEDGRKFAGRDILSAAYKSLTPEEILQAKKVFGSLQEDYKPEPSVGKSYGGTVVPQSPGDDKDWQQPVDFIVEKLKNEWSPAILKETFKDQDFLRPIDAEGVADRLKQEIIGRTPEFLDKADLFFDREKLHSHYTYSYLRAVYDLLRADKLPEQSNLFKLFKLMETIRDSGKTATFEDGERDKSIGWLANWKAVHNSLADLLKQLLVGEYEFLRFDFKIYRQAIFDLIEYLLSNEDPTILEEHAETAKSKRMKSGTNEYEANDPYTTALNSVRGEAFLAFVSFVYHDAKRLDPEGKKISEDVQKLYERVLMAEQTQALMFMFGHYIVPFHYRAPDWIYKLLPTIFSDDPNKKDLYFAAWEGYLSNNLYRELFNDPVFIKLYERAIALNPEDYTKRRYFRGLDEGLATHLALAFMHYDEFGFDHPLFQSFWKDHIGERHAEFIGFIGKAFISGENKEAIKLIKENEKSRQKLKDFWDWVLKNCSEKDALERFGYWTKTNKNIFELPWLAERIRNTLQKTNGSIDWDYGLMTCIIELSKAAPQMTLEILRLFILEHGVRSTDNRSRTGLYVHDEWYEAFGILYNNPDTKSGTYTLIDDLIREGGSTFWKLKDILSPPDEKNDLRS